MMTTFETMEFFGIRNAVALIAGLIIGIERTISGHSAGIKTLVFVSIGSCLFASMSFYLHDLYPSTDPTRIIGQEITGIGFLGAGVIFYNKLKLNGLTSAAMIWCVCSLGIIAGSGLIIIPIFASITLVIVALALKRFEKFIEKFEKTPHEKE